MVGNYNYLPDDHYAKVGISFQKYLGDQIDRAGFADEVTARVSLQLQIGRYSDETKYPEL